MLSHSLPIKLAIERKKLCVVVDYLTFFCNILNEIELSNRGLRHLQFCHKYEF